MQGCKCWCMKILTIHGPPVSHQVVVTSWNTWDFRNTPLETEIDILRRLWSTEVRTWGSKYDSMEPGSGKVYISNEAL